MSMTPLPPEGTPGRVRKHTVALQVLPLFLVVALSIFLCWSIVRSYTVTPQKFQPHSVSILVSSDPAQCPEILTDDGENGTHIIRHYPQPTSYSRSGECACAPVHNFVILSMQRSGSGWFETLLNNHPNLSSHGEIFSVRPRRQNFTTIRSTLERIYNLEWNSSASKDTCTGAVGLKWMLNQGAMEYGREVSAFFEQHHVSVVMLLRRNLLKRLISILANAYDRKNKTLDGKHKSHVHSEEDAKKLATFRPVLNAKHLAGNLQRVQNIANDALRVFNSSRLNVLYYEDVVQDKELLSSVQEFLGVEVRNLTSRQVRIHTRPLSEQVENWSEVVQALNGTNFEHFLTDSQ
eukprot:TRINITY_DN3254_c0_g1_i1.p1 TRINITY_DN3254_c0_g1~~TRINITY_DN3254_c0_g1_i1.p1  ORF type:complete len:349 (+),score=54.17 TRINITY_DN3254_c0_g1_i1:239-1285(+)